MCVLFLSLMEQELLTLAEHLSSRPGFSGALVAQSLVLCVVLSKSLLFLLSFFSLLAIVLPAFLHYGCGLPVKYLQAFITYTY